jgi:aerobic-type carbon monoxide dehydrogenase small subunit (CoxS/CutS family)
LKGTATGRTTALGAKQVIELNVNGERREVLIEPRTTLLQVLRDDLDLTGTKQACDTGDCGACTVLIDGKPTVSCLTLAIEAQGKRILTIEGLEKEGELHPLQQAFIDSFAVQCGFCTPAMILSAKALLDKNPHPSEDEVKEAISGNLCRCTGYVKIVEAIMAAAKTMENWKV